MPSIKTDHGQLAIQVVRESRGRTSHGNKKTSKNAPQALTGKKNPKSKGHSHKGTEQHLFLSNDNGCNFDLSSASSRSTKSAFARLGTQSVITQVSRSLTKVPYTSTSKVSCHSLCNGMRKHVIVEKHSPLRKSVSKRISPSFPKPADLGSLENISVFKENFHSVNNPEISVPSVQHKQPEIITVITKEPESFELQLQHNFEEEMLPALNLDQLDNHFTEEVEPECCYNTEEENTVDPQNQIPEKVFANALDLEVINLDLPNDISAGKTSPVEDEAAVEQLEDKSVREDEISAVRQKESTNLDKKPEQEDCCPCRGTASVQKTLSTVAAATAAAFSAHPLLASHNRLEVQLMTLLDKMNSLEQQIFLQKHEMEKEGKLQKLENQLSQVTKDRMNSLELLQQQMFGMQANFLNVAKSFENMFGQVPDNIQQKINEDEEKTEPLHYRSQNVQHSKNDIEKSKEPDSLESLDLSINTDKDVRSFPKPLSVAPEDKHAKNPKKEHHIEKSSSKSASRSHSKDTSAPCIKPKVNSNNPLSTAHKASNVKTNIVNGKESKSTSKPNKTVSSVNSTSKFQNSRSNRNKKYQSNVEEEKLVIKEINRNIQKPTSVTEKQSAKELPLKYSYLKTFSSNPYSKEPYAVRETSKAKRIPKKQSPPAPAILNTSYVISSSPDLQHDEKEFNRIENQNSNSKKWFTSLQSVAPLEKYLLDSPLKTQLFTSDKIYADLKPITPSAELVAGQEILLRAQTSRMFLEENLKNLERDYKKDAVYNIVDNLYENSPASQTYQMKRKVDQCIAKMQIDIQKELSMEEATSKKLSCSNPATKVNKLTKKKDSEDLSGSRQKQPKVIVKTKEKAPQSSSKAINVMYQDQEYLTQVFGKATYQNKRTTVREPYLHIRNKPQTKVTQPKAMVDVKGIQKKSTKVQTVEEVKKTVEKGTGIVADDQKYFFASKPSNNSNYLQNSSLVPGHLGYMAVSLREPRMDSGLTHAVTVRPGSSVVVAPQDQPKVVPAENVVLCTVPFVNEAKPAKKTVLSKQDLPSVDIVGEMTKDKAVKNVKFTTDSQDKNVLNTSFEKSVTIAESTDNEEEIPCERFSDGSDIVEAENDVEVVVVESKTKEASESLADNNNSSRVLPQQLELLTGLTSELILTKNHKIAATLATSQRMPIDAESIQQEEDLNEIIQLVEQEILSQIISSDQVTPNSAVAYLKKSFSAENNGDKECIPKIKASVSEDSLILSQLIEEILADKVGTILANDYALSIPTSDKSPKPTSSNQFEKGEICQTKPNEFSSLKQDAVCQTSLLLNELVLEDKNSHFTDKTPGSAVISQPLQPTSIKESVLVDTAIPQESETMINEDGSNLLINEAASYSANEINLLNLNKNSVEQGEKTDVQETTTGENPDEVPMKSYHPNFAKDSNKDAAKDSTGNIVQPINISVITHSDDGAVQDTNAVSMQSSKSPVQPFSSFVMQPSTSKLQDTNAPAMQRCISVVAQDAVNVLGSITRRQSEAERVEEVQRRRREATLAKLRIDKMESIYIPPDTRVRSPVRHVKLVEITSKSLNETNTEEKDQFITPSLPSQFPPSQSPTQFLPSQSSPSPPPPQQPASQLLLQPPKPHRTTSTTSQTTSSLQFSSSHTTTPPPSSIAHFQTSGAGKGPSRSLFSPENPDSPEKITDEQVKELGENFTVASLEGLNLAPKFDADNDNDVEEILGTDNEVATDSSPLSDKVSSESLSSGSSSSNTALESLSDGQWLLSQSEGQAALYMVSDGVYKRILADVSNPSTLKDSNELTRDDTADITYSDGEFVLQQRVPPEKDPLLQLILKMRKTPLNPPHSPEMIPGNTDANAEGQRSPGEWALSSSEIGQATFETSSDYAAAASTNVKPDNSNKMAKTVLPQQSSSRQSHIYSSDKSKTNSRVIFVGLTPDEDATAELGLEIQQDQTPVVPNLLQNGSFQPKAPITTAGYLLPSQQSFMQPTDLIGSKSVRFSQYRGIDPVVSDNALYNESQYVDASVESDVHNTLLGDGDDIKDAQSLPRPPLIPHRIPVTIPSPGEIWDDEDIEEISFQDGI
ncbi:protein TALPID3 [Octopus bimaculoides]|uniref:Protein TALPID3 n=1 Tax=Octopus bimaculoides TaxID=37653 RepID=A0A0L8H1F4_OCTBM|nr:protein TALPID3 [Octopus bimaculoides]|eukprot:XP_014776260.1 PREDICTED: protein TALPID3-like [Octopus bimaculoides]